MRLRPQLFIRLPTLTSKHPLLSTLGCCPENLLTNFKKPISSYDLKRDLFVKWANELWKYACKNQGRTSGWEASDKKERMNL